MYDTGIGATTTRSGGPVLVPLRTRPAAARPEGWLPFPRAQAASFALALGLLAVIQAKVARPMLLAERFLPGAGWAEAVLLAGWAAFLTGKLLQPRVLATWRKRLWVLFSIVFFAQLALGLAGLERFLMSGKLHIPVPAIIVGGPLFRGEGLFMPILLAVTLLLAGPAWCSYLCYIGAWDFVAAKARKRSEPLPKWRGLVRLGLLAAVVAGALGLRAAGVPGVVAAAAGIGFGLVGVAVMATLSRRTGAMVHCTAYCPIGVVTTIVGKISPWRLRITADCTDCGACTPVCRYDALRRDDVARRRPGLSCTLCGDCLRSCKRGFIEYRFPGLKPEIARRAFFALAAALHAVFLGVARL